MSLRERLTRAWLSLTSSTAAAAPPSRMEDVRLVFSTPPRRGTAELLGLAVEAPELTGPLRRIRDGVGKTPWQVLTPDGEPFEGHPLAELLARPNAEFTGPSARALTQLYLDVVGESFELLGWDSATRRPTSEPLPPHLVTMRRVRGERVLEARMGGRTMRLDPAEVLWLKHADPRDPFGRGIGLGWAALDDTETAEYAARFAKAYYHNHAMPSAIVGLDGAGKDEGQRMSAAWRARYAGQPYGVEFTGSRVSVAQLQTGFKGKEDVELRRFLARAVRLLYGVPPEILGEVESSNRATALAAQFIFAAFVLEPRLNFLRDSWQEHLLPRLAEVVPAPYWSREYDEAVIAYTSPVPADEEARRAAMTAWPEIFTINERRAAGLLPPREGGDVYLRREEWTEVEAGDIEDLGARKATPPPLPRELPIGPVLRVITGDPQLYALREAVGEVLCDLTRAAPAPVAHRLAAAWRADGAGEVLAELRAGATPSACAQRLLLGWEDELRASGVRPDAGALAPLAARLTTTLTPVTEAA